MFVIFLKFGENKSKAPELMESHNQWLRSGFEKGVFMLAGSLQPALGGAILAKDTNLEELEKFVNQDPFVVESVVMPEIHQIAPVKADERLDFLMTS